MATVTDTALRLRTASITDGDLVRRALDGEVRAFDALYRRHATTLGGIVIRLMRSRQDADDVVHDVFVDAFEKLHTLRNPDAFRSWIRQITVMNVRGRLRKKRARRRLGLRFEDPEALADLVSRAASPEQVAQLRQVDRVLGDLPVDQRIVWMLRHVEGHQMDEIASICGRSLSTVKRWEKAASRRVQRGVGADWATR